MKRRAFLKSMGAAAVATGLPGAALARSPDKEGPAETEELATLLDLGACVGCEECVYACRESNAHKQPEPQKPFPEMVPERVKVEDWSERRDVTDRLTPYNWLYVEHLEVEHQGEKRTIHMPRRCMHCQNPPCANLCPWGAAAKHDNGAVSIDSGICLGGSKCRKVCPWHIPQRQTGVGLYLDLMPRFAGNGVMYKCDRCLDRLEQGRQPACIEACPMGVQTIGPRSEILAQARKLAEETGGYLYGADENGGANTVYVSPVPFEKLAEAQEQALEGKVNKVKSGRPGLRPVDNAMEDENKLAGALLLGPVAGLAAGVLKTVSNFRKTAKEEDNEDQ